MHRFIHSFSAYDRGFRQARTGFSRSRWTVPCARSWITCPRRAGRWPNCRSARVCACRSDAPAPSASSSRTPPIRRCRASACGRYANCSMPSPLFAPELLELLQWTSSYYHHPPGEVIAAALPAALRVGPTGACAANLDRAERGGAGGGEPRIAAACAPAARIAVAAGSRRRRAAERRAARCVRGGLAHGRTRLAQARLARIHAARSRHRFTARRRAATARAARSDRRN